MVLTDEIKSQIDSMDYVSMLRQWRFAAVGDHMFEGESGKYFSDRMFALRNEDPLAAIAASKTIGWGE